MSFRRVRNEGAFPAAVWDRVASEQVADKARDIIDRRAFEDSRTIDGAPMEPYAPSTLAAKGGDPRVTLQDTGAMRSALRVAQATVGKIRINAGSLRQVVFQNRARPFLGVGRDDAGELHAALTAAARTAIERARGARRD